MPVGTAGKVLSTGSISFITTEAIMNPEAAEAIRIADKHLAGEPIERRKALALDIQEAIVRHAGTLASYAIGEAFKSARNQQQQH